MISVVLLLAGISQLTPGWGFVTEPTDECQWKGLHVSINVLRASSGSTYLHSFWNGDSVFQYSSYHVFNFTQWQTVHDYSPPDIDAEYLEIIPYVDDQVILLGMSTDFTTQALCYQIRSATGSLVRNTTLLDYLDAEMVDAAVDSDGIAHVVASGSGPVFHIAFDPEDASVLFLDTLTGSSSDPPAITVDDRVHIIFNAPPEGYTNYVQYDLEGNMTIPPTCIVDTPAGFCAFLSIALDPDGDPFVFLKDGAYFMVYKLDGDTGERLLGPLQIALGSTSQGRTATEILPCGTAAEGAFYLLWVTDGDVLEFNVMGSDGTIEYAPPYAYYYIGGDAGQVYRFTACADTDGFIYTGDFNGFWDDYGPMPPHMYYVTTIHAFTPGLGAEGGEGDTSPDLELGASCNPFSSSVAITCEGEALPGQLMVYDITGRPIRSLSDKQGDSFLWDGRDAFGVQVPVGTYLIQGAVDGHVSSIRVVRL